MNIETICSPQLMHQIKDLEQKGVVVIDILRATSTINAILSNGALAVYPVSSLEEARSFEGKNFLIGGERNGTKVEGFDFGNSPLEYQKELVKEKNVVLTTTNGTKSIDIAKNANELCIGSFGNLSAIAKHMLNSKKDWVLLCAGWKNKINLEDSLFAGAICSKLKDASIDDASLLCQEAYQSIKGNLFNCLKKSSHFKRLSSNGISDDIAYCCVLDNSIIVPVLEQGKLVPYLNKA